MLFPIPFQFENFIIQEKFVMKIMKTCLVLAVLLAAIVPATVQGVCDSFKYTPPIMSGFPDDCSCYIGTEWVVNWSPNRDGYPCTLETCNTIAAEFCSPSTNAAPTATGVSITGTATVGQTLTGSYTYADAENDAEGTSTFKWYAANDSGKFSVATGLTYTPTERFYLYFEVTPVAKTGTLTGTPVMSAGVQVTAAAPGYSSTPAPGSIIDVGSADVNASVSKTLSVSETGNAELQVTSAELSGIYASDFSVTPATLTIADGGACAGFDNRMHAFC